MVTSSAPGRRYALYNEATGGHAEFHRTMEARWTTATTAREAAFQRAEEIFLRELPATPLVFSTQASLMSPSVKSWQPKPFAERGLKQLWLEP